MSQPLPKTSYTIENAKEHLASLLHLMKIDKVYFVDDSLGDEPNVNEFIGLIRKIQDIDKLKDGLSFFEFKDDLDLFIDNINDTWDNLTPDQRNKCFVVVYKAVGKDYTSLDVSSSLKTFFNEDICVLCSPAQWEQYILHTHHKGSNNILVLFDQDLNKSGGVFVTKKGEDLIIDIKKGGYRSNIFPALFTYTITNIEEELSQRVEIVEKFKKAGEALSNEDFFVFTKDRLYKPDLFADAIKKLFLNQYCEQVKDKTLNLALEAFNKTIEELKLLDTYSFDFAILKSSLNEGIWEVETLLRVINIYLDNFIKVEMIKTDYLLSANEAFEKAHAISKSFNISVEGINTQPYQKPIELRAKEIYEQGEIINGLYKPLENGDIFELTDLGNKKSMYVLVAQECDLMLRSTGERKLQTATLLYLSSKKIKDLVADESKSFKNYETNGRPFTFWDTRYKLDHFETTKVGIVNFTNSPLVVDLNFLDLVSFNHLGEAEIELKNKNRIKLQASLEARENIVIPKLIEKKKEINVLLRGLPKNKDRYKALNSKLSPDLVIIGDKKIPVAMGKSSFSLKVKRIKRLRQPYARLLLEKYMEYLTRNALLHDFAKK
ncbi:MULTISPECIES: hypothetical protein [unclassified Arcicella]|uniref:hypothetical protein n=1 Tax=unclassified Arcicella TaxID=2644986 RepID=UPI002854C035|nr:MULTISPECIES: hypothetical protein [unclassified Arcicella]MDR6563613.1 hypothetical protein [Arcicella sp. BE51]MDR6814249.1 hypothetical protein [Arcicella sp. BE140]MDR6825512.1 hypothetical protein [Arcicella sp. BE139]